MIVDRRLMWNARKNRKAFLEVMDVAKHSSVEDRGYFKNYIRKGYRGERSILGDNIGSILSCSSVLPIALYFSDYFKSKEYTFLVAGMALGFGGLVPWDRILKSFGFKETYFELRSKVIRTKGYEEFSSDRQMKFWYGPDKCLERL